MSRVHFVVFDVAGTLLHKPELFACIVAVLRDYGFDCDKQDLVSKHKMVSEMLMFPDKTSREFYNVFNRELLLQLAIEPTDEIVEKIFTSCRLLAWQPFTDTAVLEDLDIPIGVLSNWNGSLKDTIARFFPHDFDFVISSQEEGLRKPDEAFYRLAIEKASVDPRHILYIGDSVKLDIIPARSMGFQTLLIDRIGLYPSAGMMVINDLSNIKEIVSL